VSTSGLTFSCILPTYNRSAVVEQTLRQLIAVDYPKDRYEIIVADNSTDDTPAMVQRVAAGTEVSIRLLTSTHRLPAIKRNEAIQAARGEFVVLMNDDLWVRPDFLRQHERSQRSALEPTAVLGHVEQSAQMEQTPFIEWYRPFAYHELEGRSGESLPWLYFWSMNLSAPRAELVDRNLLFHEDWAEIGSEDVELGWRWVKAGNRLIYNPEAWGEHFHPHTLASACRLQESVGRGLRDLEVLVPDPNLLQRYGVLSWRNEPKVLARQLARTALFNRLTVGAAQRWLESLAANNALSRWMYWKVLLYYTTRGYRQAPPRQPEPRLTLARTVS
jgi:glycosyltransferase involved in cell wall biosynthesis